jgi:hypothetical protein
MCHDGKSLIRSTDIVAAIKRNLGRDVYLLDGLAELDFQRETERELACECTTPADRDRIRRTMAMILPSAPRRRRRPPRDLVDA